MHKETWIHFIKKAKTETEKKHLRYDSFATNYRQASIKKVPTFAHRQVVSTHSKAQSMAPGPANLLQQHGNMTVICTQVSRALDTSTKLVM